MRFRSSVIRHAGRPRPRRSYYVAVPEMSEFGLKRRLRAVNAERRLIALKQTQCNISLSHHGNESRLTVVCENE